MAIGPGKYDVLATAAREAANANGVVLIILDGEYGNGFSAQLSPADTLELPSMLRELADTIERDLQSPH